VWSVKASPKFAKGTLDGYFDNKIPEEFWRLLALYICTNTLSSLPWAIPFGEKEITTMKNQAKEVLFWYNDMKEIIPKWYYEE
jgi:aminoglycoside phosphotransferase (APT) family kinase protein